LTKEQLVKGEVVYLYAFDVANEIRTAEIRQVLSQKPFPYEIRLDQTAPRYVPLYRPLAVEPPPLTGSRDQEVRLLVRIYEVGVVTVAMRIAFDVERLAELLPFHNLDRDGGPPLHQIAREVCTRVCGDLHDFMERSSPPSDPEVYTVFCLKQIEGVVNVPQWLAAEARNVAGLLAETNAEHLSDAQIAETVRVQRSFESTDLTVIDWDAALVVDLTGYVDDVLYVLELANIQLEEFRMMDRMLDQYLIKAYEDLERKRFLRFGTSTATLSTLRRFRVDLTKLADEVTNITKLFGDWYLARVYLGASERFHLDHWRSSVDNRLGQLDQLYSVFHSEVNERRMLWLEIVIVVLLLIDVAALFFWKT
jgi:hypothetical protein